MARKSQEKNLHFERSKMIWFGGGDKNIKIEKNGAYFQAKLIFSWLDSVAEGKNPKIYQNQEKNYFNKN